MRKGKFGVYGSASDLAEKIDHEGGLAPFFCYHSGPDEFKGTPIEWEVAAFRMAYSTLYGKLDSLRAV